MTLPPRGTLSQQLRRRIARLHQPGHGLGINDLKVIETRNLLRAIAAGERVQPDFHEGARVQYVMDMFERSSAQGSWVTLAPRARRATADRGAA